MGPAGVGLGGRMVCLFSFSRWAISCSICALNSFEARLNSFRYLPTWRAISGNFFGPKMMRAKKNRKIVSEKLIRSSYCRSRKSGNHAHDKDLTRVRELVPQALVVFLSSGEP